jgi:methylglutaconyl-CoA hydratase
MTIGETSFETLELRREDDLLWVTLRDPDRANALSPAMVAELTRLYGTDLRAEGVRALLLAGAGRHFSAGADLAHLKELEGADLERNRRESAKLEALFRSILTQEALTVALVHGACVAGGCGVATAHDFVVAAEDARFMYSEVRIGFVAALVATFLPLRVAGSQVKELLLNPDFVDASRAREIGLADRVVPPGELSAAGRDLAVSILTKASSESIARTKRLLWQVTGLPLGEALARAAEANAQARMTDDCRRGVACFLEHKQPPRWRDAE